jgi:DNA-binding MarR family transcriptional regulator
MTRTTPPTDGYVLEDQIGFRLRKAHQRATEIFNEVMGEFDVTPTQFAALARLYDAAAGGQAGISQNQLGRLTAMDPATIYGVVQRLYKRGLVASGVDAADARLVVVDLTPEGLAAVGAMRARAAKVSRRTLAPLTDAEATGLLAALAKLG